MLDVSKNRSLDIGCFEFCVVGHVWFFLLFDGFPLFVSQEV